MAGLAGARSDRREHWWKCEKAERVRIAREKQARREADGDAHDPEA
jgi:hypothetical protein